MYSLARWQHRLVAAAISLSLILLYLFTSTSPVAAASFNVDHAGDESDFDPGDGACATSNNFCTLRAAIEEANALTGADTIAFLVSGPFLIDSELSVTSEITIIGSRGMTISPTGASRIFNLSGAANLELVAITASGGSGVSEGGGIYISGGTLTLTGSTVMGNSATSNGGGIFAAGTNSVVNVNTGSSISGNSVSGSGGGIYAEGSALIQITGGSIDHNSAIGGGGIFLTADADLNLAGGTINDNTVGIFAGGGVYAASSGNLVTITDGSISGNIASVMGGGILGYGGAQIQLNGGSINDNSAPNGGGVYMTAMVQLNVAGGTINDNTADNGGGVYAFFRSVVTVTSGSIKENTAAVNGGGVFATEESQVHVNGGSINTNLGGSGGGVYVSDDADLSVAGGTVNGNIGVSFGGGVYATGSGSTVTVSSGSINNNTFASVLWGGGVYAENSALVRVTGGSINNNGADFGGGIYASSLAQVEVSSGSINSNIGLFGGGVYARDSGTSVMMTGGSIHSNNGVHRGGGVYVFHSGLIQLNGGSITTNRSSNGGGVYLEADGDLNVAGGTINANTVNITEGGGVYATGSGSTVTISSGSINDNAASASGGGVYATNSAVVQVIGGRVNANGAPSGGGIYADTGSIVTVTNSAITGNTATTGGGIRVRDAELSLINTTFSSNVSNGLNVGEGGGALASSNSTVLIVNSTIANNNALQAVRSGIWLASGAVTVQNSIVANNNGSHNCAVTGGLLLDNGYNLDNGTSCGFTGTSLSNVDPNLAPLADNGGATQTMALLPGSPAINGGSDALAVDKSGNPLTNDQRGTGYTRKNGTVDIGALEAVIGTLNVQFTLQGRDGKPVNDPSRVVTAHVRIMPQDSAIPLHIQDFTTSSTGTFTIPNLPVGTYRFSFKGSHTLARLVGIAITTGTNSHTTALMLEGDANNDNSVALVDFSLLAAAFGSETISPNYDARTDFNNDGTITLIDFSLLASNFGKVGDLP